MSKQEYFVTTYFDMAFKAARQFNLNALIILSQGALESAWGTSYSAMHRKNFFGITVGSGKKNPYWDGAFDVTKNDAKLKMRVYKTASDSFFDYARLVRGKYQEVANATSIEDFAEKMSKSRYIQDSDGRERYRKNLIGTYKVIHSISEKKNYL